MIETLEQHGWIEFITDSRELDAKFFDAVNPPNVSKLHHYWKRIEKLNSLTCPHPARSADAASWKGYRSKALGKTFEKLFESLFDRSKIFSVTTNVSTSANEIDILIEMGMLSQRIPFLQNMGTHILGEAKCHADGPSNQWVTRLRSLMDTHLAKFSILITGCSSRKVHSKVRYEISLHSAQGFFVVVIGLKQIQEIMNGKNFLTVLKDQHSATKNHFDLYV